MSLTRGQRAVLHIARKELGFDDDEYREVLFGAAGVRSSTELDAAGFGLVMDRFRALGWQGRSGAGKAYGYRHGMASPAQIDFIRALWAEYTGKKTDERTLGKWLERTFKVSAVRFLTADQASQAIGALRAMAARSREAWRDQATA